MSQYVLTLLSKDEDGCEETNQGEAPKAVEQRESP